MRIGGRLTLSHLRYPQPIIILPGNLCDLLVEDAHYRLIHMGVEYTLSSLRSQGYWIRRKLVKSALHRCLICRRLCARPMKQQMAPLPPERVTPSDPFAHVGIDAFGPFVVTSGRTTVKRWVCVFNCFSTHAIHIEKLDGLDCNAFIDALMRLSQAGATSQQGYCSLSVLD